MKIFEDSEVEWHIGRSWHGTPIEDVCPCPQEPCGLIGEVSSECEQHPVDRCKTIRQSHRKEDCPGTGM